MNNECPILDLLHPTEENEYCLFTQTLEQDRKVFFHVSAKRNHEAILNNGFRSALDLGIGELRSVSYARKSSSCLSHLGNNITEDFFVYAVRFESVDPKEIVENISDIHVYGKSIQPSILGYCVIPKGFTYG